MAPKKKSGPGEPRKLSLVGDSVRPGPGVEWEGLRVPFGYLEAEQEHVDVELWVDARKDRVVHHELVPKDADPVSDDLHAALTAQRPDSLRVADEAWALALKSALPQMPVSVGATPGANKVARAMREDLGPDRELSYLTEDITPTLMGGLFDAAQHVYAAKLWLIAEDWQVIRIDAPTLGLVSACASVIGALGQSFGVMIFSSLEASERLVEGDPVQEDDMQGSDRMLSLSFDRGADLPAQMRDEVRQHAWPVVDAQGYPSLMHVGAGRRFLPVTAREVEVMTACLASIVPFVIKHQYVIERQEPHEPIIETYTGTGGHLVKLALPAHEAG